MIHLPLHLFGAAVAFVWRNLTENQPNWLLFGGLGLMMGLSLLYIGWCLHREHSQHRN
jgi:hypothetical protein